MIRFASALVISDWTGPTDNGWEINFPTGIITETKKENYEEEIRKIFSRQLCLLYAQSFEAFEKFVKDCLFDRLCRNEILKDFTISLLPKKLHSSFSRQRMPGGDNLYKVLKKAGGKTFKDFTSKNNMNIKYSELWTVLSEVRHSIVHKESILDSELLERSKHHKDIFEFLFDSREISSKLVSIELDYQRFDRLIKRFSEFGYQIFKILSIEEKLKWNIK